MDAINVTYLIIGIFILIFTIYDFFFTTLSSSGAGFISRRISLASHKIIQSLLPLFGRRIYSYSGLVVNLSVFFTWLLLVWFGLYLIYSSDPDTIINSKGIAANALERLYFTGYVLSTLGMGNFYPTTVPFEILTSIFSFFGFVFFTSSITYFLSVSSAINNKRTLARSIQCLGKTPESIASKFLDQETSYSFQQMLNFQMMIEKHVVNHQAYPVVHYYSHPEPAVCLGINIVRLDEALSILLTSEKTEKLKKESSNLRSALTGYFEHLDKNYSQSLPKGEGEVSSKPLNYEIKGMDSADLNNRRKLLRGILRSEGFEWNDVSPRN